MMQKNSLCTVIFAIKRKFRYDSEILLCSENSAYSENFATIVEIDENSYELCINQHNFDAKLDMMIKVYETCKTTKNNLETKLVVLKGPTHVNRLK